MYFSSVGVSQSLSIPSMCLVHVHSTGNSVPSADVLTLVLRLLMTSMDFEDRSYFHSLILWESSLCPHTVCTLPKKYVYMQVWVCICVPWFSHLCGTHSAPIHNAWGTTRSEKPVLTNFNFYFNTLVYWRLVLMPHCMVTCQALSQKHSHLATPGVETCISMYSIVNSYTSSQDIVAASM